MGLTSASTPNTPRLAGREASTTSLARFHHVFSFSSFSPSSSSCQTHQHASREASTTSLARSSLPLPQKLSKPSLIMSKTRSNKNNLAGLVRPLQGCGAPADFAQRTCDSRRPVCTPVHQLTRPVCTPVHQFTRPVCTGNPQTPTSLGQLGPRPSWQAPGGTCDPDSRNVDLIRAEACHQGHCPNRDPKYEGPRT